MGTLYLAVTNDIVSIIGGRAGYRYIQDVAAMNRPVIYRAKSATIYS